MKLNGNKTPSMSVPESVYCMTGDEYIAELKMLEDPVWAGMSLEGLCYVLSFAADFLGDLVPVIGAPGASDPF